ncbi:MAG TPA: universal stress protein [Pseudomonas sp.]|jgi:universal stress protein E|uniref:universal stress protein n=1 Tax=Pseudomonas sp. TaxID=306 RepID=UPI002ED84967
MSQYQRLLLIADDDFPDSAATERAVALAIGTGASIHVLALVQEPARAHMLELKMNEEERAEYFERYEAWVQASVALLQSRQVHVTFQAIWTDDPLTQILIGIRELKPDVVIKGTQMLPLLKRVFMTPLDWDLLHASAVPVHFVNHGARALPNVVVAAVDPSNSEPALQSFNQEIIKVAEGFARQCCAELHLVYAYDLTAAFMAETSAAVCWVEELRAALFEPFKALADSCHMPDSRRHFVMGSPVKVIKDLVQELRADVVVMGAVQPKGLGKLIGDTTERALQIQACSVLTIKPGSHLV